MDGIVGYNTEDGIIYKCKNTGKIMGTNGMGGIVGRNAGKTLECYNLGDVEALTAVGGIAGENYGGAGTIMNCYNIGRVKAFNKYGSVGGITAANEDYVINCYNLGEIMSDSISDVYGAGIVGHNHGIIYNVYNKGNVSASNGTCVGGIVGIFNNRDSVPVVSNCYNLATVTARKYVGGIISYMYDNKNATTISNCYNINNNYFGTTVPTNITTSNIGIINSDGTFPDSTPYVDLLTALNAWVNENKSIYPELKNWKMGDNNFPTFID